MTVTTKALWMQIGGEGAVQARRLTKAIFGRPGIINSGDLAVTALATPAMKVHVAASTDSTIVAGSEATDQGYYAVWNDAVVELTVAAADSTNGRIDAVYIKIQDSEYSGTVDKASVVVVTGTAAATPVAPDAPTVSHYLLCTIAVAADATSITNADITDERTTAVDLFGTTTAVVASGTQQQTFSVTFDTPYAAAPTVIVSAREAAAAQFSVVTDTVTATGFSGLAYVSDGTNAASSHTVSVNWDARGARAA